jgi:hypothetical protein
VQAKTCGIFEPLARSYEESGYLRCRCMDQEVDRINDLETLESLLGDIERAITEERSVNEQQQAKLKRLREECIVRKKELTGDKG